MHTKVLLLLAAVALVAQACDTVIRIGFVYQSPVTDVSWTYTHEIGRRALQQKYCSGPVRVETDYRVVYVDNTQTCPFNSLCFNQTVEYIGQRKADGSYKYDFISLTGSSFPTSDSTVRFARMFPEIKFLQASRASPTPNHNIVTYAGYIEQARYLEGIVAGLTTQTGKLAYINVNNQTQTFRQLNAFAFGVQRVNPNAVIYAKQGNTFGNELGDRLASQQVKAQVPEIDLFGFQSLFAEVSRYACEFDMMSVGYGSDIRQFVDDSVLTSAAWEWLDSLEFFINQYVHRNFTGGQYYSGTIAQGSVSLSPLSSRVSQSTADYVEQTKANVIAGTDGMFCDRPEIGICPASYMISGNPAHATPVNGVCAQPAGTCLTQTQIQSINRYLNNVVNLGAADLTEAPQYGSPEKVDACWNGPVIPDTCYAGSCSASNCAVSIEGASTAAPTTAAPSNTCVFRFQNPSSPSFNIAGVNGDRTLNTGNPIVLANGNALSQGCNGNVFEYFDSVSGQWRRSYTDNNGQIRNSVDNFYATGTNVNIRTIQSYQSNLPDFLNGKFGRVWMTCNNNVYGCAQFTINQPARSLRQAAQKIAIH